MTYFIGNLEKGNCACLDQFTPLPLFEICLPTKDARFGLFLDVYGVSFTVANLHGREWWGVGAGPCGYLALPETTSFPECHSASTSLSNKADVLFSTLLTLQSISQLFPNLGRN